MRREAVLLLRYIFVVLFIVCGSFFIQAQTVINGKVLDKTTFKPVSGATITVSKSSLGTSSNKEGLFTIKIDSSVQILDVKAMGYEHSQIAISQIKDTIIEILLTEVGHTIDVVEINQKIKYKNRNPATDLIDLVIKNKKINKLEKKDSLYYKQYDKVKFGLIDPPQRFVSSLGEIGDFFSNRDTSVIAGHEVVTIYMQEDFSENYIKQSPSRKKKIISSQQKTEFDQRYINNPSIESYMQYLFQDVDIYDESLFFINKLFLSPIADNAKTYYKYYVVDTVILNQDRYIKLRFEPRNATDLLFKGDLLISMDSRYAVRRAQLTVDKNSNISWVNDVKIDLSYMKHQSGVMLQDTSKVVVVFGVRRDAVFGERLSLNHHYNVHYPIDDHIFSGAPIEVVSSGATSVERPIALNYSESQTYSNIDQLNNNKSFRAMMITGYLLAQGFYSFGKFELGPLEYLYHRNNFEGNRFRIGGRSTELFSEKVYLEGYLAYGTSDNAMKYYLRTAVSLNGKSVRNFPAHYLEGTIQHDIFEPGKGLGFLKGDSFFRSFRSNQPIKWLNTDAYRLGHVIEFGNHVSLSTQFTHQRRNPVGDLRFPLSYDSTQFLSAINTNDLQVVLRWAPNEKFYYRNMSRTTIREKYPVFSLQYNRGLDGFWGGNFTYDALRFSTSKRFFMNQLGFGDASLTLGKIWGTLPYPLLEIPNVEEQKDRHSISFDMTNSMEFVADEFIRFGYDHELNGFILNKIPLIKKLKWREVFGAKMFYGRLSNTNNPYLSPDVVYFDKHKDGYTLTNILQKEPYWEGYVGLDNIFKIFRVEYYRRLNYLTLNNVDKDRFRVSLHFNF